MKIKQLPEDFRVEEIADFELAKKGGFKLYSLEKKGLETFFLINYIAKHSKIPLGEIGIAGLKDRHAITRQHLTIPARYEIMAGREENFKIEFMGFVERKIKLGDLIGNRFEITVRDINKGEIEGILMKAKSVEKIGVPNYFDSQRFGSAINGDFIAKRIIKSDFEGAVKVFLTSYTRNESKRVKDEKRLILCKWDSLQETRPRIPELKRVVEAYNSSGSWLIAFRAIPEKLREIYISSYQSYLWNECVKKILRKKIENKRLYTVEYAAGKILLFKDISYEEEKSLPVTFSTISDEIVAGEDEKPIISRVLEAEGLSIKDFAIKEKTGNFFKSHERQVILKAANLEVSEPSIDEINSRQGKKRLKITLRFSLPKGSYATIVTKRIFNR